MKTKNALLLLSLLSCAAAQAATNFNGLTVDNSVIVGNSVQAGGGISAGTYFGSTSGYVSVGGSINSGSTITAAQLLTGNNGANITNLLSILGTTGRARIGSNSAATGNLSLAIGDAASAQSYSSVVIGKNNVISSGYSTTAWAPADPLFVVGNGTSSATADRNNAFTIYKDGTVTMSKAQGDIAMGQFGN